MNPISIIKEARTANKGLAIVAVQCSPDTFVVNQSFVLRINISGKNRHLRQAAKQHPFKPTGLNLNSKVSGHSHFKYPVNQTKIANEINWFYARKA
jgi:hypothetical protein